MNLQRLSFTTWLQLLAISGSALAQSAGGGFVITKSTIDGGGGRSSGGSFTLNGSIGQTDASSQAASGGQFGLSGGFWTGSSVVPSGDPIFSNSFEGP